MCPSVAPLVDGMGWSRPAASVLKKLHFPSRLRLSTIVIDAVVSTVSKE